MSSEQASVVLVGLGPTAESALEALVRRFRVCALVRSGSADDPVVASARRRGVAIETDASVDGVRAIVTRVAPDAVVVSSFDRILPADLVDSVPFVNVHYAPLPRYRGRATVNWAILNGEPEAAISIHRLVPGLDAGGVLAQETVGIGSTTTVTELYAQLNAIQQRILGDAVARAIAGDHGQAQDEDLATYTCTRVPDDGEINWSESTERIDRLLRALTPPFPGAYTWLGLERIWIDDWRTPPETRRWEGRVPGRVVGISRTRGWIEVLTGDGVLRVLRVRRESPDRGVTGDSVEAASVVRTVKATLGLRTADLVDRLRSIAIEDRK